MRLGAEEDTNSLPPIREGDASQVGGNTPCQEEGIIFDTLINPVEVIGDNGWVTGLKC